jgi:hypothetical protein
MERTIEIPCGCGAKITATEEVHAGFGAVQFVICEYCQKQHQMFGIVKAVKQEPPPPKAVAPA